MSRKLPHAFMGLAILSFFITGIFLFINAADESVGATTDVNLDLQNISETLDSDYKTFETDIQDQTSNVSIFEVKEQEFLDKRTLGEAALGREDTQATAVSFFTNIQGKLKIHTIIVGLLISIIAITVLQLFWRTILGDSRW